MAYFTEKIGTPTDGFTVKITYSITTPSTSGSNQSKLTSLKVEVKANNNSYTPYNSSKTCDVTISRYNNSGSWVEEYTYSNSSSYSISGTTYETFMDRTTNLNIPHKSDGTQKVKFSVNIDGQLSSYYPKGTFTKTITLPTIDDSGGEDEPDTPTTKTTTLNSVSMSISSSSDTATITTRITKQVSSYEDVLYVTDTNNNVLFVEEDIYDGTDSFNLSSSQKRALYSYMENTFSTTLKAYLVTYTSGGTEVGTSSKKSFTASIPSYSLSFSTLSVTDLVTEYDRHKPTSDTLIANLSQPQLTFGATSSNNTTYGNSILYRVNEENVVSPYVDNNFTGGQYLLSAIDGRTDDLNYTTDFPIVNYFKPIVTASATRPTPTSTVVNVSIYVRYHSGNGLTSLKQPYLDFNYKEIGNSEGDILITVNPTAIDENTLEFSTTFELSNLDPTYTLEYSAIFADRIGIEVTDTNVRTKGYPLYHGYTKSDGTQVFRVYGNVKANNFEIGAHTLQEYIESVIKTKYLDIYPVGSLYISTNSTNPGDFIGGTWTQITNDAYLKIVSSDAGNLGGTSAEHKIPLASMPKHRHEIQVTKGLYGKTTTGDRYNVLYDSTGGTALDNGYTTYAGSGNAYYPYYYGIYVWKRTA